MLRITADVYSGRPNPSWILTDEKEARAVLREIAQNRQITAQAAPTEAGLGFRGLVVESLSDEIGRDFDLATSAYVAAGSYASGAKANELVDRLISLMPASEAWSQAADVEMDPLDESFQTFLREQLESSGRTSVLDSAEGAEAGAEADSEVAAAVTCTIELAPYNPGFWNNNPTTRQTNNCYNYASNKRTNTFAQPGRGCGHIYSTITCPEMTRASLCDGLHRRFDCFPPAEAPRYLVALVVAPGPGFRDFHWYRKMKEGFWGHKPGSTPVRNVDNSGRVITNPATCDRGPYTHFCGYFYTCRSQRIR
jgi:hypothetical protein